jgi:tetratricopeptide (TPR) repeat protein
VELLPAAVGENAADHLAALVRKELVRPTRSELAGDEAFRFRHQLIRDAAYEGLPKELRAELHERFADWLDRTAGVLEREEVLGYHLEQSYRYRTELGPPDERTLELARRASALLGSAGRRAHAHGDLPAAAKLLERAVELAPERSAERIELMIERGTVLTSAEGDTVLAAAIEEAVAIRDRRLELLARIERESSRAWVDPGARRQEADAAIEEGMALFAELGDEPGLTQAWLAQGRLNMSDSQWRATREAYERAAVHAERAGDAELALGILAGVPVTLCCDPTPAPEALRRTEEILARVGDHPRAHTPLFWSAGLYTMLGDFDEARSRLAAVRAMIEGRGRFVERTGAVGLVSGLLELWAGDPEAAERDLRGCCDLLARVDETGVRSTLTAYLGEALYRLGRHDEAARCADESEALASADDRLSQAWLRIVRAKVLARRGDAEAAEEVAREAVALAADSDYLQLQGDTLAGLGETLVLLGRQPEAANAFEQALSAYERKGILPEAARMRALLGSEAPTRSA